MGFICIKVAMDLFYFQREEYQVRKNKDQDRLETKKRYMPDVN
ncbi:MAG: hypothetical protein R6T98_06870 [Desulfatiglandales bacterium]